MTAKLTILSQWLSRISVSTGKLVSWLTFFMVVFFSINILSSWLFQSSSILVSESITWMHSANFLLACAYTLNSNEHVRVDIFYAKMSVKSKSIVDLCGTLLLLLPVAIYIFWASWSYVVLSWKMNEVSAEAGGFANLFILKGFLLAMPLLLVIEAINQIVIQLQILTGSSRTQGSC